MIAPSPGNGPSRGAGNLPAGHPNVIAFYDLVEEAGTRGW